MNENERSMHARLQQIAQNGMVFTCSAEVPFLETINEEHIIVHLEMDYFENGDVICPNCKVQIQ